jgi:fructose-bisphosphate aldolase class II
MSLKRHLQKARKDKKAIGQFNFSTLDQLQAILSSSVSLNIPVIVGTSVKEATFFGMAEAATLVGYYQKKGAKIYLNLDHGRDIETVKKAIDVGYNMVHFDGSKMDFEANIKDTKRVVSYAHKKGILVEGEVGYVPGQSAMNKCDLPDVDVVAIEDVVCFVKNTNVDLIALPFGSVHGIYSQAPKIKFKFLKDVSKIKPFLVLHGGSGVKDDDIKKAIKLGITKINVNTELRMVWRDGLKQSLKSSEYAPYSLLNKSRSNVESRVKEKLLIFW